MVHILLIMESLHCCGDGCAAHIQGLVTADWSKAYCMTFVPAETYKQQCYKSFLGVRYASDRGLSKFALFLLPRFSELGSMLRKSANGDDGT
jgi:hypothetical protein